MVIRGVKVYQLVQVLNTFLGGVTVQMTDSSVILRVLIVWRMLQGQVESFECLLVILF